MLGPLPKFYAMIVALCALAAFIGIGVWIASELSLLFLPLAGAGVGAAAGMIAVLLLLHDFERPPASPH